MKKVMVVGACGWLGERLVSRLKSKNYRVIGVDIRKGPGDGEFVEADMREVEKIRPYLAECETLFNCGGLQHPARTKDLYAVNRDAPVTLYKACMESGVRTFVHISSIAAFGANESSTERLSEETSEHPITHYGASKAEGDALLLRALGSTRLVILRPGVFYGENPSKNLRELLQKMGSMRIPFFGARGFLRTYVNIESVVDALILAETRGESGDTYIVGDEDPMSTLKFYRILAEELDTEVKLQRVPLIASRLAEKAAWWAGLLGLHLRLPTIVGEFGRHTFGSPEKARRILNFNPARSSEEGLRNMVRSTRT